MEKSIKDRSEKIKALAADLIKERKDAEVKAAQAASTDFISEMDSIIESQASKEEKRQEVERVNGETQRPGARPRRQASLQRRRPSRGAPPQSRPLRRSTGKRQRPAPAQHHGPPAYAVSRMIW